MTKAEKHQLVDEYRTSGKSKRVWCREKGIPYTTFLGWSRRMRQETDDIKTLQSTSEQINPAIQEPELYQPVMWATVKATSDDSDTEMSLKVTKSVNGGRICLSRDDWTVNIEDDFNAELLVKILRAVNVVCC